MACSTTVGPQKVLLLLIIISLAVQTAAASSHSIISITSNASSTSFSEHAACQNSTVIFTCTASTALQGPICWDIDDDSDRINADKALCGDVRLLFEDIVKYWPSEEDSIFSAVLLSTNSTHSVSTLTYQGNGNSSSYTLKCSNASNSYETVIFNISECNAGCLSSQCNPKVNGTATSSVAGTATPEVQNGTITHAVNPVVIVFPIVAVTVVVAIVVVIVVVYVNRRHWSHKDSQKKNTRNREPACGDVETTSQPIAMTAVLSNDYNASGPEKCEELCSFTATAKVPLPTPSVELEPGKTTATSTVLKWELSSSLGDKSSLSIIIDYWNADENKLTNHGVKEVATAAGQLSGVVALAELEPGVEYTVMLAASDGDEENMSGPIKFKTPAIPASIVVSNIEYLSAIIEWPTKNLEDTSVIVRSQYFGEAMMDKDEHKVPGTEGSVLLNVSPGTAYTVCLTVQNKYGCADTDPVNFITPVEVTQPSTDKVEMQLEPRKEEHITVKFKHFRQKVDVVWFRKDVNGDTYEQIEKHRFYHNGQSSEAVEQETTLLVKQCPHDMPSGTVFVHKVEMTPVLPSGTKTSFFMPKTTERYFAMEIVPPPSGLLASIRKIIS